MNAEISIGEYLETTRGLTTSLRDRLGHYLKIGDVVSLKKIRKINYMEQRYDIWTIFNNKKAFHFERGKLTWINFDPTEKRTLYKVTIP